MAVDREDLSADFWAASDRADAIRKKVAPLRKKYDDFNNEYMEKLRELGRQIKEAEQPLVDAEKRRVALSLALGGKIEPRKK